MREVDSADAIKAFEANVSRRMARLGALRNYVKGTQYDGLPDWFDDSSVPVTKRAPCVVEPVAYQAVTSFGDLILGEGRTPSVRPRSDGADDDDDDPTELDLGEDEAARIDRFIRRVDAASGVMSSLRTALEDAMSVGSTLAVACLRDGVPCLEIIETERATPTWKKGSPGVLASVEVRYPYIREYWDDSARKWRSECLIYRRVIDAESDTTFKPARANQSGAEPKWVADPDLTIAHGLGFCPAHWYAFDLRQVTEECFDGEAIHALLTDEIDALNRGLSQRNRAALYLGDPQLVELGVDKGTEPAPAAEMFTPLRAIVDHTGRVMDSPESRMANAHWRVMGGGRSTGMGRKKGPGVVWRYPAVGADGGTLPKVDYLTLPPGALEAIERDINDLRQLICTSMSYVPLDPASLKGLSGSGITNISGRMLEWLYQRQLIRASKIRGDFGPDCIVPVYWMLLRVCAAHADGVYVAGARQVAEIVNGFRREIDGAGTRWLQPRITLTWPPYFPPTEADQATAGKQARDDHEAGLVTLESAVARIAPAYGIDDVSAYVEQLRAEKDARQRAQMELMHAAGPLVTDEERDPDQGAAGARPEDADGDRGRGTGGAPDEASRDDGIDAGARRQARRDPQRRRR